MRNLLTTIIHPILPLRTAVYRCERREKSSAVPAFPPRRCESFFRRAALTLCRFFASCVNLILGIFFTAYTVCYAQFANHDYPPYSSAAYRCVSLCTAASAVRNLPLCPPSRRVAVRASSAASFASAVSAFGKAFLQTICFGFRVFL